MRPRLDCRLSVVAEISSSRMPYALAGNAAAAEAEPSKCTRSQCGVCIGVSGLLLLLAGLLALADSANGSRGLKLARFNAEMARWIHGGQEQFTDLQFTVGTSVFSPERMHADVRLVTPEDFGESSLSTDAESALSSLQSVTYRGIAKCLGGTPNRACRFNLEASNGVLISKRFVPAQQEGPQQFVVEASMCQWYDSDLWHPMATVGMGKCNNQPPAGSRAYSYGPSLCVLDQYLSPQGCPNDLIQSSQLVQAGNGWATVLESKPRFEYASGKCWDYSDCYCTGCGVTLKTDTTQGWGFTGYGYYVNGR